MKTYTMEEIRERLTDNLENWSAEPGVLVRTYRTGDWPTTLLAAGAIAFLAESSFHHPDIVLGYDILTVRLTTHDAGGVTDRDFELARRIEEVLTWQPGPNDALEGKPKGWIR